MIKHYVLKPGIDHEFLIQNGCKEGGNWIHPNSIYMIFKDLNRDISLNIGFPEDLSQWNEFDYILILDEACGQPYGPFYKYYAQKRIEGFPYLRKVMNAYNKAMDSLPFFEEKKVSLKDYLQ